MRLLSPAMVVLAHPSPDSFNHAIASEVRRVLGEAGVRTYWHDLYAEGFDPVLGPMEWRRVVTPEGAPDTHPGAPEDQLVAGYRQELSAVRGLVVVHPNWWGQPPAILTGWLDRVLIPGVAYRLDRPGGLPESLLDVHRMLVINTSDTPPDRERTEIGDPLDSIWRRAVGPCLGAPEIERMVLPLVGESGQEQRRRWLTGVGRATAWLGGADR